LLYADFTAQMATEQSPMPTTKITKRIVDGAKADPTRDTFIWDSDIPGFGLKITRGGAKVYLLQYRMGGRGTPTRRYTIGRHGAPWTPEEARNEAVRLLGLVRDGVDPMAQKRASATAPTMTTVADVIAEFLERHASKNRSVNEVRRSLQRDVVPAWGDRPITDITRRDIIALLDGIAGRAPVQANRVFSMLRKLFNWCVDRDILPTSPCVRVKPPGQETDRDRTLSDDELKRVWRAADLLGWPFGPATKLLILTAQRRDEIAMVRWNEINLEGALWTIPAEKSKNGQAHEVPLSPAALDILNSLPHMGELVFTTTGTTPISGFSKAKVRLDKLSEVTDWRLHDLRRTATTGMAKMGIAPHVVDRILNHTAGTIRGVAAVYNRHAYLDERRVALDAWARRVDALVNGTPATQVPMPARMA
jgi:integrase